MPRQFKKNNPGCGCCGVCSAHNPNATQLYVNPFDEPEDLDTLTLHLRASIDTEQLLLSPGTARNQPAFAMYNNLGCTRTNLVFEITFENQGFDLDYLPNTLCQIGVFPSPYVFFWWHHFYTTGGPVTIPHPGRYRFGFPGAAVVDLVDTPAIGDEIMMRIWNDAGVLRTEGRVNGVTRYNGTITTPLSDAQLCNISVHLQASQTTYFGTLPGGSPWHRFDNLIASASCG